MKRGFVRMMRTKDTFELLKRFPNGFRLACVMALKARWEPIDHERSGRELGQSKLGDHESYGMTQKEYRVAKKQLKRLGHCNFRGTGNGTIGWFLDDRLFDLSPSPEGDLKLGVTDWQSRADAPKPRTKGRTDREKGEPKHDFGANNSRPKGELEGEPEGHPKSDENSSTPMRKASAPERNGELEGERQGERGAEKGRTESANRATLYNKSEKKEEEQQQDSAASPRGGADRLSAERPETTTAQESPSEENEKEEINYPAKFASQVARQYPAILKLITGTVTWMTAKQVADVKEFFEMNPSWGAVDVFYVGAKGLIESRAYPKDAAGHDRFFWSRKYATRPAAMFTPTATKQEYPILCMGVELGHDPSHFSVEEIQREILKLLQPYKDARKQAAATDRH